MLIYLFILGSVIASFLNAQIYRYSQNLTFREFLTKPSNCEQCKRNLSWWELIPVVGFLISRGKCQKCGYQIPLVYPVSELILAFTFALLYLKGFGVWAMILLSIIFVFALFDLFYLGIPKKLANIFFIISTFVGFYRILILNASVLPVLIGFLLVAGGLLLNYFYKKSFGFGDFIIIVSLAFYIDLNSWGLSLFLTIIYAGLFAIIGILFKKLTRKDYIPLIPFIYFGLLSSLLFA